MPELTGEDPVFFLEQFYLPRLAFQAQFRLFDLAFRQPRPDKNRYQNGCQPDAGDNRNPDRRRQPAPVFAYCDQCYTPCLRPLLSRSIACGLRAKKELLALYRQEQPSILLMVDIFGKRQIQLSAEASDRAAQPREVKIQSSLTIA